MAVREAQREVLREVWQVPFPQSVPRLPRCQPLLVCLRPRHQQGRIHGPLGHSCQTSGGSTRTTSSAPGRGVESCHVHPGAVRRVGTGSPCTDTGHSSMTWVSTITEGRRPRPESALPLRDSLARRTCNPTAPGQSSVTAGCTGWARRMIPTRSPMSGRCLPPRASSPLAMTLIPRPGCHVTRSGSSATPGFPVRGAGSQRRHRGSPRGAARRLPECPSCHHRLRRCLGRAARSLRGRRHRLRGGLSPADQPGDRVVVHPGGI